MSALRGGVPAKAPGTRLLFELVPAPRRVWDTAPGLSDREQIARLFDPSRDPEDRVRDDDWHPEPDSSWAKLDLCKTIGSRRRWYLALLEEPSHRG